MSGAAWTSLAALSPTLAAVSPTSALYLAAALFAVGLVGVACRRNILIILLSIEILLNAGNLAFVAFSQVHGDVTGQVFVFFAMTIAAAEVAVGLAIVIALFRLRRAVDADAASLLRERDLGDVPPIVPEGENAPHAHDHAHEHADAHDAEGHGPDALGAGSPDEAHAADHDAHGAAAPLEAH